MGYLSFSSISADIERYLSLCRTIFDADNKDAGYSEEDYREARRKYLKMEMDFFFEIIYDWEL